MVLDLAKRFWFRLLGQRRLSAKKSVYLQTAAIGVPPSLDPLEPRVLFDAAPVFITDMSDLNLPVEGGVMHVPVDAFDSDGDNLLITAVSDDPNFNVYASNGNRMAQLTFVESDQVTPFGDIVIELFDDRQADSLGDTPNTDRFVTLATTGYNLSGQYDPDAEPFWTDVLVHRVARDFVIQTGDKLNGDGTGGSPLGHFDAVVDTSVTGFGDSGVVAWANSGHPSASDNQFFITTGAWPVLSGDYAIIGLVIRGYDVLEELNNVPRESYWSDVPVNPPILQSVEIFESNQLGSVTMLAGPEFDGRAQVTVTLDDQNGNITEQVFDTALVGFPPIIEQTAHVEIEPGGTKTFDVFVIDDLSLPEDLDVQVTTQQPDVLIDSVVYEKTITTPGPGGGSMDIFVFNATVTIPDEKMYFNITLSAVESGFEGVDSVVTTTWDNEVTSVGYEPLLWWVPDYDVVPGQTIIRDVQVTDDLGDQLDVSIEADDEDLVVSFELIDGETEFYEMTIELPSDKQVCSTISYHASEVDLFSEGVPHATKTFLVSTIGSRPVFPTTGDLDLDPGETHIMQFAIDDDGDLPLTVGITTDHEDAVATIEQDEVDPELYTISLTAPSENTEFNVTITAVEAGFEDNVNVVPATQTVLVSTVGTPPVISDVPSLVEMAPGQVNIFNITITDNMDADLDVAVTPDDDDVTASVVKLGETDLYEVTIELPPDNNVLTDVTITASEAGFQGDPRAQETFQLSTLGDRPQIEASGPITIAIGQPSTFTPVITDDLSAVLSVGAWTDAADVDVQIDGETHEVTISTTDRNYRYFEVSVVAVEDGIAGLTPTLQTFEVITGLGVVETDADADTRDVTIVDGRMFVANTTGGLKVFDVADITQPVLLGEFNDFNPQDVAVAGTTAFIVDRGAGQFISLDVSDPANITELDLIDVQGGPDAILIDGNVAFVTRGTDGVDMASSGLTAIDITDPENLVELDSIRELTGGQRLSTPFAMAKKDQYLFIADTSATGGVDVIDVSQPSDLKHAATTLASVDVHYLVLDGDLLYCTDSPNGRLMVLNVKRPTKPKFLGYVGGLGDNPMRVNIIGNTAIVSHEDGFRFVDVTDPEAMFTDQVFEGLGRGGLPLVIGDQVALPFWHEGKVVFIDDTQFKKRNTTSRRMTIIDDNDVEVKISIRGPGVVLARATDQGVGNIESLLVHGSTKRTSVTITTRGGETAIGDIAITGYLNSFKALTTDLTGDFISNGFIKNLKIDDINLGGQEQATVYFGYSSNDRDKTSLTFDEGQNLYIASQQGFRQLRMGNLTNTIEQQNLVNSTFIKSLRVELDFEGNLSLLGAENSKQTLGRASIGRRLVNADWDLVGDVGSLRVRDTVEDTTIHVQGQTRSFKAGHVVNTQIEVDEKLRRVQAIQWDGGEIIADEIGVIKISGDDDLALAGDLSADIVARDIGTISIAGDLTDSFIDLSQAVDPVLALNRMTVKGFMADSTIRSRVDVGNLTLGGLRNSTIFAGVSSQVVQGLPQAMEDFLPQAEIRKLRVMGIEGQPFSVINTNIAAWILNRVSLVGVQLSNGGVPFGLSGHEINLDQPGLADGDELIGGGGPGNDSVLLLL